MMKQPTERRLRPSYPGVRTTCSSTPTRQRSLSLTSGNTRTQHRLVWWSREKGWNRWGVSSTLVFISQTYGVNTKELVKKTQERLFFLQTLRKTGLSQKLLTNFYQCTIESVLNYECMVWFSSCTSEKRKDLQRIIKTAQKIIGAPVRPLKHIHSAWLSNRAEEIRSDCSDPGQGLFDIHPCGRLIVMKARTERLKNNFFSGAMKGLLKA